MTTTMTEDCGTFARGKFCTAKTKNELAELGAGRGGIKFCLPTSVLLNIVCLLNCSELPLR